MPHSCHRPGMASTDNIASGRASSPARPTGQADSDTDPTQRCLPALTHSTSAPPAFQPPPIGAAHPPKYVPPHRSCLRAGAGARHTPAPRSRRFNPQTAPPSRHALQRQRGASAAPARRLETPGRAGTAQGSCRRGQGEDGEGEFGARLGQGGGRGRGEGEGGGGLARVYAPIALPGRGEVPKEPHAASRYRKPCYGLLPRRVRTSAPATSHRRLRPGQQRLARPRPTTPDFRDTCRTTRLRPPPVTCRPCRLRVGPCLPSRQRRPTASR